MVTEVWAQNWQIAVVSEMARDTYRRYPGMTPVTITEELPLAA